MWIVPTDREERREVPAGMIPSLDPALYTHGVAGIKQAATMPHPPQTPAPAGNGAKATQPPVNGPNVPNVPNVPTVPIVSNGPNVPNVPHVTNAVSGNSGNGGNGGNGRTEGEKELPKETPRETPAEGAEKSEDRVETTEESATKEAEGAKEQEAIHPIVPTKVTGEEEVPLIRVFAVKSDEPKPILVKEDVVQERLDGSS